MKIEDLPSASLEDVIFDLEDIRHDLGKYIGFETRFVGTDASEQDRRAALKTDVLATRSAGARSEAAWTLWARVRPASLHDDPDVLFIDRALAQLQGLDLDTCELAGAVALADQVAQATRRLLARARACR